MKIVAQNMLKMIVTGVLNVTLAKYWFWLLDEQLQYKVMNVLKNKFAFPMEVYLSKNAKYIGNIEMENIDLSHFSLNEDFLSKHYMQVATLKMGLFNYSLIMPNKTKECLKPVNLNLEEKPTDADYFYSPGIDFENSSENRVNIN